jgi:hypothetical protein
VEADAEAGEGDRAGGARSNVRISGKLDEKRQEGGWLGRKEESFTSFCRSLEDRVHRVPARFVKRLFSPCSIVQGGALLGVAQILVDHTYPTIHERRESDLPRSKFALTVMR